MAKRHEKRARADVEAYSTRAQQRGDIYGEQAGAGYGEFAKTGGVSPEQEELTRRRTASGISSLYDALKRNVARRSTVQGGYAPGVASATARLGRGAAQETGRALSETELGLLEQQRQGRLAGLGGLGGLTGMYEQQIPQLQQIHAGLARTKGIAPTIMDWMKVGGKAATGLSTAFGSV